MKRDVDLAGGGNTPRTGRAKHTIERQRDKVCEPQGV
jgi:hypothetical protein